MTSQVDPTPDSNDPWIGQTFAGYTILRRIGEGGMGIVYLARHNSLDRLAAVKFLPATMASDAAYIELFLREAKAAAKLNHPNVVGVHDAGSLGDGIYYFIMEYVEGRSLGEMLDAQGKLPVREVAEYLRQAAGALAYAHKKLVIHRDIKPENLLLTSEGIIKVVDLGLAKWTGEESSMLTQTGDILGSPVYISPERLRDPHVNDPRTDVYSLGGTFFHLVTGRMPYEGSSPVIMARHLTDPVPDPRDVNPQLDAGVSGIIMKMMAKEPGDRFQTMDEVEKALAAYLAGESKPELKAIEASRPSVNWLLAGGVFLVAMVAGFFVAPLFTKSKQEQPPEAAKGEPPSAKKVEPAPAKAEPLAASKAEPSASKRPPVKIADFNTDSRVNLRKGRFGAWNSARPDPLGRASEKIQRIGGPDGSGCWEIDFDITNPGSYVGSWMELVSVDVSEYDTLAFKVRSTDPKGINFIAEIKLIQGGNEVVRRSIIHDVKTEWETREVDLRKLHLPSGLPLTGLNFVFDQPVTGIMKAAIFVDDIEFIRKN